MSGAGLGFLMRLQSICQLPRAASSEGLAGAGGMTFKLTQEALGKRSQFFSTWSSP